MLTAILRKDAWRGRGLHLGFLAIVGIILFLNGQPLWTTQSGALAAADRFNTGLVLGVTFLCFCFLLGAMPWHLEIQDRTLSFLFTRPEHPYSLVMAKYASGMAWLAFYSLGLALFIMTAAPPGANPVAILVLVNALALAVMNFHLSFFDTLIEALERLKGETPFRWRLGFGPPVAQGTRDPLETTGAGLERALQILFTFFILTTLVTILILGVATKPGFAGSMGYLLLVTVPQSIMTLVLTHYYLYQKFHGAR